MTDKSDPQFKYFPCTGESLSLLRQYDIDMNQMVTDRANLVKEFEKKMKTVLDTHQASLRETWRRLSAMVGLDPDVTWGNNEYQPEVRYLDDGFGAITFTPNMGHSFADIFGGEKDDVPEMDMNKAPDKSRLN